VLGPLTFDRAAFEAKVFEKSPLLPRHFDVMLGDVAEKKAIAWQIMQMPAAKQSAIWEDLQRCRVYYPNAVVENAK
jgi:hypothetical protein